MIETQFHKVIKKFLSNNALELQFIYLFASKGVIHPFSFVERLPE